MTDSGVQTSPPAGSSAPSTVLLPILPVPTVVLPGTLITIALDIDAIRLAVDAAVASDARVLLVSDDAPEMGVVARVPNTGALPSGQPAAIVQAESRALLLARHASERGADRAEVQVLTDPRPTPRIEAATRELRVVLQEIAKLRGSRRLPELLRSVPEPGALVDAVVSWAEVEGDRRVQVLRAVDVEQRVTLVT